MSNSMTSAGIAAKSGNDMEIGHDMTYGYRLLGSVTLLLLSLLVSGQSQALTLEEKIRKSSPDQVNEMARWVAETMASELPMKIDKTTTAKSVGFVRETRTLIYFMETTTPIDVARARAYIVNGHCSDRIRSALISQGISIQHVYALPNGKNVGKVEVRYADCKKS